MDKHTALLVIDYTCDFVADDGALTCGAAAQRIDKNIVSLIEAAESSGACVAVCNDVHEIGDTSHPEYHLFPAHNIRGSEGRELYGLTRQAAEGFCAKHPDRAVMLDKTRYNAFFATELHAWLQRHDVQNLVLTGVCTDICILHTAIGGYELNYKLKIHENAVASFNEQAHEFAIAHMAQSLGAQVVKV